MKFTSNTKLGLQVPYHAIPGYPVFVIITGVLREVYDICEPSYRTMGDNLGGGKAGEPLIGIWLY